MNFEVQLLKKSILIVDDDEALSESIKEVLASRGFQNIHVAYSISEGINVFSVSHIDLIILDVMLPDGEGYLLSEYVRESSDVPILFLTAKNNPDDEIRGLNSGGDDYVTKPFLPKSLTYRIIALLRRAYKDESEIIELDNCTIDLSSASVKKNDEILSLTPTEIQILRKLYANKNGSLSTVVGDEKLTSREDLIGLLFFYVQSDEDTFLKVDEVSKTETQPFDVFDQLISCFKFCV